MTISERVKSINPSQTLAITAQALKMKREGKKVISFAAGEPDFSTPKNINGQIVFIATTKTEKDIIMSEKGQIGDEYEDIEYCPIVK